MHRFLLWLALSGTAVAHDGHGAAPGAHLHASDLFGLVLVAVLIGAWWLLRGRR